MPKSLWIASAIVIAFIATLSHQLHRQHEVLCCTDPVGMAQQIAHHDDSPAMCLQDHGTVVWVDGLFVGCQHANVYGSTISDRVP